MSPMHLNVNITTAGVHRGAWRRSQESARAFHDPGHYVRNARIAERGLLDAVFLADQSYLHAGPLPGAALDPLITVAAMAQATTRIGLIASVSTTFHHPYTIARAFASLEHLSGGRTGWNVVTTRNPPAGRNYGFPDLPSREERYARAAESVDVVTRLWGSWEPGALVADRDAGVQVDQSRVHPIDHVGQYFSVTGPLQVPPSPQGRPLIVQAGGSSGGLDLAAGYADAVFTSQVTAEAAREYYTNLKKAVVQRGRAPESLAVLPGLVFTLGSTEAEATRRRDDLNELVPEADRLAAFAGWIGVDPAVLDLDKPFPLHELRDIGDTYFSVGFDRSARIHLEANRHRTVRELVAEGPAGHWKITGTPEQVADAMEEWYRGGAADGFNLMADAYPDGLEDFVDHVVPILQRRGLFRREYDATTLRGHYGLAERLAPTVTEEIS
ncbi:LLM class flavin-dependent oxidoreductase [Rhodococcus sp. NPDC003318]|uniref:LLM class flavin-dependent oxidoreductase n=1 Tax=Rhodococcus sp. NPDC003318 TaxID=3364503 RepID=UPI00369C45E5